MKKIAIALFGCLSLCTVSLAEEKTEPKKEEVPNLSDGKFGFGDEGSQYDRFDHLVNAVATLRGKRIPEAFFWLESPQIPGYPIFAPDCKGGGYIIIEKTLRLPEGVDPEKEFNEFKKDYKIPKSLRFDPQTKEILFYSDDEWEHFQGTMQPWTVKHETIELGLVPKFFPGSLVIRLPKEGTEEFLETLLGGWKIEKDVLKCYAGWN